MFGICLGRRLQTLCGAWRACNLAEEKDDEKEAALKFIKAVKELVKICEIPTLKEYGINKDEFVKVIPKMAEDAIASGSPGNTRKEIRKEDCEMIYHELIG